MEPSTSHASAYNRSCRGRGSRAGVDGRQHQHQRHGATGGVRAYGLQYGNELMQPEWMTDVPADLASSWLVMPRPEGLRCLLVTSRGRTCSWLRNGAPLHRWHSVLPGGSPATVGGCGAAAATAAAGDYCLLDCVFHPPTNTYYIQDLLCWRGYALYDCGAEFRLYWLTSKLQEEELLGPLAAPPPPQATSSPPPPSPSPSHSSASSQHSAHGQGTHSRGRGRRGRGGGGGGGRRGGFGAGAGGAGDGVDVEMGDGAGGAGGTAAGVAAASGQEAAPVQYRIVPLPVRPCTLGGLREAYGDGSPAPASSPAAAAAIAADPWVTHQPAAGPGSAQHACPAAAAAAGGAGPAALAGADGAPGGVGVGPAAERGPGTGGPVAGGGGGVDFVRDGLYFLHRQGHYAPGPVPSPLALLWKDAGCSRYLVDTDARGLPLEHQHVVLSYRADRTVATEDEPPVVLGRLPEAFVAAMGDKLWPGRLLRFSIRQGGITFHEGRPAGADLHYEGPGQQRRGRADSFSKILFQRMARTAPLTAAALAAALAAEEAQAAEAEGQAMAEAVAAAVLGEVMG